MRYVYLVVYFSGASWGNCEYTTHKKLSSLDRVRIAEREITGQNEKRAVVINFKLLREEG